MASTKLPRAVPSLSGLLFGYSMQAKAIFYRQLSTMVSAALPISRAVRTGGGNTKLTQEMAKLIDDGYPLSQVMARYPHYFSDYEVAVIKSGEHSGTLDTQLKLLAGEMETSYVQRKTLMGKLAYPVLVAHSAVFIPPLVLLVTKGPSEYFHLTLGIIVPFYLLASLAWIFFRISGQSSGFRKSMDSVLAFIPVLGGVLRLLACSRFLRVLSHLNESGFLPDKALHVACESCGSAYIASRIIGAHTKLGDTARTSQILIRSGVFSPTVCALVASGEESGQMGMLIGKAGEMLETELQSRIGMLMTLIPVLMLIGVGGVVGVIVIKIFGGYTALLNSLSP